MSHLSIITPLYNEQENINELIKRINSSVRKFIKKKTFQLVLVDNGSTDNTYSEILKHKKNKNIKLIKLSRNFGYYGGIQAGLKHSDGLYTVVIDGDLQDPPELIEKLYKKIISTKSDVVYGIRNKRTDFIINRILIAMFYRLFNILSSTKIPLDTGEFCIISKRLKSHLISFREHVRFNRGLRSWLGFKQVGIKYNREDRYKGKGVSNLVVHFLHAVNSIITFSNFPLRIVSIFGSLTLFLTLISSIVLFIYWIADKFNVLRGYKEFVYNVIPQGFTTFGLMILLINIFIVFSLSVLAIYISKIFEEIKRRPQFIVDEVIDF